MGRTGHGMATITKVQWGIDARARRRIRTFLYGRGDGDSDRKAESVWRQQCPDPEARMRKRGAAAARDATIVTFVSSRPSRQHKYWLREISAAWMLDD